MSEFFLMRRKKKTLELTNELMKKISQFQQNKHTPCPRKLILLKFKNFKLNPVQYPLGKFNYLYNLATNHFHLFYAPCPKNFVHFFYQWGELPIFPLSLSNISVCSIHLSLSLIFFMKLDHTTFFFFHHSHRSVL